jgi:hypothetical protein
VHDRLDAVMAVVDPRDRVDHLPVVGEVDLDDRTPFAEAIEVHNLVALFTKGADDGTAELARASGDGDAHATSLAPAVRRNPLPGSRRDA